MKSTDLGELTVPNLQMEVTVVGNGFGESIVVSIGHSLVIGIDCCASMVKRSFDGESQLQKIIGRCTEDLTVIWIVSHYHFDHFQGMTWLLKQLRPYSGSIHRLLLPRVRTPADFANLAALDEREESGWEARFSVARAEYLSFFSELEAFKNVAFDFTGRATIASASLLCKEKSKRVRFSLEGFSPNRFDSEEGEANAFSKFMEGAADRKYANESSYIIRLSCDEFESLFLGDVPLERSESLFCHEIQEDWVSMNSLLKVAHHGSDDATSKTLLMRLCPDGGKGRAPCALIAPFRRHGLPKEAVLKLLLEHGYRLRISGGGLSPSALGEKIQSDYGATCGIKVLRAAPNDRGLVSEKFELEEWVSHRGE